MGVWFILNRYTCSPPPPPAPHPPKKTNFGVQLPNRTRCSRTGQFCHSRRSTPLNPTETGPSSTKLPVQQYIYIHIYIYIHRGRRSRSFTLNPKPLGLGFRVLGKPINIPPGLRCGARQAMPLWWGSKELRQPLFGLVGMQRVQGSGLSFAEFTVSWAEGTLGPKSC